MKKKRIQKSLSIAFFESIKNVEWSCVLADTYLQSEDHYGRYCEITVLDDLFLESLGRRELQRFNKVRGNLPIPQGWSKDKMREMIKSSFEDTTSKIPLAANLLEGMPLVEEEEHSNNTIQENINVVVDEDSESNDAEVSSEGGTHGDNTDLVEDVPFLSELVLGTENSVSGTILARLEQVNSKLDIVLGMLSNPIFAANSVGVKSIDLKISALEKVTYEQINLLSIADLRKYAEQLGVPNSQYHLVLRESVRKEHKRLNRVVEIADKYLITPSTAEKALLMSEKTGITLEKAIQVC